MMDFFEVLAAISVPTLSPEEPVILIISVHLNGTSLSLWDYNWSLH